MAGIVRNVLALIVGVAVGSAVNMGLILMSGHVIPPPAGVDVADMESIRASIHLFEPRHFVFPFLAHALGTLVGAFGASLLAVSRRRKLALGVAAFFLVGGIVASFQIPAPAWFIALDLIVAYLPMGWLGGWLGKRLRSGRPQPAAAA